MHGMATTPHSLPMVRRAQERVGPLWAMVSTEVGSMCVGVWVGGWGGWVGGWVGVCVCERERVNVYVFESE